MLPIEAVFKSISELWRSLDPGLPSPEIRIAREKETRGFERFESRSEEPNLDPSFTDSMRSDTQFNHPTEHLKPRVLGSLNLSLESQSPPRQQKFKTPEVLPAWRDREDLKSRTTPKGDVKVYKPSPQARTSLESLNGSAISVLDDITPVPPLRPSSTPPMPQSHAVDRTGLVRELQIEQLQIEQLQIEQLQIEQSPRRSSMNSALSTTIAVTAPWLERRYPDFSDDSRRSAKFEVTAPWDDKAILSLGKKLQHLRS